MATVNVQGRIDMRSLATVARAYIERGSTFASRSDLMWKIVEDAAIAAERAGAERPENDEIALDYLLEIGINLQASDRGRRETRRALIQDTGLHDHYGDELFSRAAGKRTYKKETPLIEEYQNAVEAGKRFNLRIPSFEEFKKNKDLIRIRSIDAVFTQEGLNKPSQPEGGVVKETTDVVEFEKKERERLAAEKAAASPEALRALLLKGGED